MTRNKSPFNKIRISLVIVQKNHQHGDNPNHDITLLPCLKIPPTPTPLRSRHNGTRHPYTAHGARTVYIVPNFIIFFGHKKIGSLTNNAETSPSVQTAASIRYTHCKNASTRCRRTSRSDHPHNQPKCHDTDSTSTLMKGLNLFSHEKRR